MSIQSIVEKAMEQGKGILRLAPTWVPRSFCVPGRRLKLHPSDYYSYGGDRGGIDERWFSSTTPADNGPKTSTDEERDASGRGGRAERRAHRRADLERPPRLADVFQVLRQQGRPSPPRP